MRSGPSDRDGPGRDPRDAADVYRPPRADEEPASTPRPSWLVRLWRWLVAPPPPAASGGEEEAEPFDPEGVVEVPIEDAIDLHHFAPRDIPSVVDEYLRAAREKGFVDVRVIHGRGKGVQRARVQKQLAKHPLVVSFRSDGTGSTLVTLRARKRR